MGDDNTLLDGRKASETRPVIFRAKSLLLNVYTV